MVVAAMLAVLPMGVVSRAQTKTAVIVCDAANPSIAFAATDIETALKKLGFTTRRSAPRVIPAGPDRELTIVLGIGDEGIPGAPAAAGLGPQGYVIRKNSGGAARWYAIGTDRVGAMYAGLELAEDLDIGGAAAIRPWRRGIGEFWS